MNIFKLDLMTVLIIVVLIGVIATMTTQAGEQSVAEQTGAGIYGQAINIPVSVKPGNLLAYSS